MEPCDLIVVKTYLCMFQLAPVTIYTHERQLCGSCGADKTCVILHLVAKMSDRFLQQRMKTKFFVKLGRSTSYTHAVLSETWGRSYEKEMRS
jgi:hypothetical protein